MKSQFTTKQVDDQTWLVIARDGTRLSDYALFCVTGYDYYGDQLQLKVFDLYARPNGAPENLSLLEIRNELFSTVVWAEDHSALVQTCTESFVEVQNPTYPIELVYEFGGEVCGKVPIFNLHTEEVH
jgi:hypothetical protein